RRSKLWERCAKNSPKSFQLVLQGCTELQQAEKKFQEREKGKEGEEAKPWR
ncbi:Hypothetical predicted protein, partial [Xyrichtys novacula]